MTKEIRAAVFKTKEGREILKTYQPPYPKCDTDVEATKKSLIEDANQDYVKRGEVIVTCTQLITI